MIMEKKQYITPCAVIMTYQVQNLLKTGSDLPPDPNAVPRRRTEVF